VGREGIIALTPAELWDPATGTFMPAGELAGEFAGSAGLFSATLLPGGDVLALGRGGPGQIWRVASETFTPAPAALTNDGETTATPLLDGRVLVIRGHEVGLTQRSPSALILSDETTTSMGTLLRPRSRYATTLLPDGRVLISGGVESAEGPPMASVEVFDPALGTFREASPLGVPVSNHQALLLPDGRVLIVFDVNGPDGQAEPFIYDPGELRVAE
jgi:hypothetical protein